MYKILKKEVLNPTVTLMEVEAPLVARRAEAGQFIILRVDEDGERIPLTIAGFDRTAGWVRIIFQTVGATTAALAELGAGDYIADLAGPLGRATETDGLRRVCVIGGGVGCAIALPIAEKLHAAGCHVTSIVGFRSKDLVILEDEFRAASDRFELVSDDGSVGRRGNVCMPLDELLASGERFDMIFAIGPLIMMKFAVASARPYSVPVTVSMNPIMIDGTGMCGGCRLTLIEDGRRVVRFACVDGPDFDGYAVDFDEAMCRGGIYRTAERHAYESRCNLLGKAGV